MHTRSSLRTCLCPLNKFHKTHGDVPSKRLAKDGILEEAQAGGEMFSLILITKHKILTSRVEECEGSWHVHFLFL